MARIDEKHPWATWLCKTRARLFQALQTARQKRGWEVCKLELGSKLPFVASPARPTRANTLNNTYEESRPQRLKSSLDYRFDDALKVKQLKPLKPKKEEMKKILRDSSSEKLEPKFKERKDKKMGKSQRRAEKDITELPLVIHVQRQPAFLKIKTHEKNMPFPKIDEDILKKLGFAVQGILPSIVPKK
ncbi:uncharacterized protein LOC125680451 [Ostrea edulis]|uniref:uncharacterized protein LOC125680451 n=1 Tax=Ostrea edulis TaxID=37623 RepID=UPI0024AF508A|nr:uncharacterized protein LOC125680451 [Ostrea edulis]